MFRHRTALTLLAAGLFLLAAFPRAAQAQTGDPRPEDTETWEPVPPVVTPGPAESTNRPPSDALVLFDGSNLDAWVNERDGSPAGWPITDGMFTVDNEVGSIRTRQSFDDYQLHIEWRVPEGVQGRGQTRGNSGLFLSTGGSWGYEVQILEAHANETYVNGMAGSVYKQSIPLANPARPPGKWQVYDVLWRAPRFDEDGELASPARVTVIFNGVVVQDAFELQGQTRWIGPPVYQPHGPSPILLQAHGDPGPMVSFRNIWLRELLPLDPPNQGQPRSGHETAPARFLLGDVVVGSDPDSADISHRVCRPGGRTFRGSQHDRARDAGSGELCSGFDLEPRSRRRRREALVGQAIQAR